MNELKQGFSRTSRLGVVGGSLDFASMSLETREANARLIGEVLAFLGLLVLLAALFFWRHISGYDFIRNGWIDLPSHVASTWNYTAPQVSHVVPSEYRHDPHGAGVFMVVLLFVTFSAILRRRRILVWLISGFCLVPWPLIGLTIPGIGFAAAMIIFAGLVAALRHRNLAKAGMFLVVGIAVWTYFSLGFMNASNDRSRPAVRVAVVNTPGAIRLGPSQTTGKLNSMAELKWPDSLADAKAYLLAQDAFFRGEPKVVAENLPLVGDTVGSDQYASLRIAGLKHYLLSEGIGSSEAVSEYQARRWRMKVVTDMLLGLGTLLIIVGLSIEWIAGAMKGRIGRLEVLKQKIDATGSPKRTTAAVAASPDDNIFTASLRRVRFRLRWALGVAAPLVIGGVVLALLAFYLRVPSSQANNGFSTVHMLAPLFDNFPKGFDNVTANQRMLLVAPTMWPYYLGGLLALGLLGLRRFRLFLALVLLITFGGQLSAFVFPRSGVVEVAVSDFKPETIRSIEAASSHAKAVSDPQQARALEAYHYTLAQLAYLAGDPARTAKEIDAVGTLDFWAYPSVEWRLAIMHEWAAMNGPAPLNAGSPGGFAMPDEGRAATTMIMRASLLLIVLASPAILLTLVYQWRRRRIHEMQNAYAQLSVTRRTSNIFRTEG